MKKIAACFLAALLLLSVCLPTQAAEVNPLDFDPMEVFQGLIGSVYFALPGAPVLIRDADYPGQWTDSFQLLGNCYEDGAEYQLRTADISPWIAANQEEYPEDSYEENALQAMFSYASFMIEFMGGKITDSQAAFEEDYLYLKFNYTYPDTPGEEYSASCILDGTRAVCLCAEQCGHGKEALSRLAPATEEQKAAFAARQPETVNYFGLSVTFPCAPSVSEKENSVTALCFPEDFTLVIADYIPVRVSIGASEEEVKPSLQYLADREMQGLGGEKANEGTLSGSADTLWQFTFTGTGDLGYGEPFAQSWVGMICISENGVWYFKASDTETGRAFIRSIRLAEETPDSADTGLDIQQAAALSEDRQDDGGPATLYQFARDLDVLFTDHAYNVAVDAQDLWISLAFYSDGAWRRAVTVNDGLIFAVLTLSSDSDTAFVNGLRVYGTYDADPNAFLAFAACCAEAAEGGAAREKLSQFIADPIEGNILPTGRYQAQYAVIDPEHTDLYYKTVILTARQPAPQENSIPAMKEGDSPSPIAESFMTAGEFLSRWEKMNQSAYDGAFPLTLYAGEALEDGDYMQPGLFGGATMVVLYLDGPEEDARISQIMVIDFSDTPPMAFLGGLLSFYAVSGIPDDIYAAMCMAITDHPLYDDLADLSPIIAWNGCMYQLGYIDSMENDEDMLAAAWITGIPETAD